MQRVAFAVNGSALITANAADDVLVAVRLNHDDLGDDPLRSFDSVDGSRA
jgi:hypothetical protein